MSDCPYITSLDKPCGRTPERLGEVYCDLHGVLAQIDALDIHSGNLTITVPPTVRPMVDRILSDFRVNLDARPWTPPTMFMGYLTDASLRRNESLRIMRQNQEDRS